MPRYRANGLLFVDGSRVRPGQTFESDGKPGKNWVPLEAPQGEDKAEAKAEPKKPQGK